MGYMLPQRFIRVAQKTSDNGQYDVAICATRIVAIMSTDSYQARRVIKDEKRAGTLINASGKSAVKSAIFLDNGSVVASPLTVSRIMSAIEKSNSKQPGATQAKETVRLKVYQAVDELPDETLDVDVPDTTTDIDDELLVDDDDEIFSEEDFVTEETLDDEQEGESDDLN